MSLSGGPQRPIFIPHEGRTWARPAMVWQPPPRPRVRVAGLQPRHIMPARIAYLRSTPAVSGTLRRAGPAGSITRGMHDAGRVMGGRDGRRVGGGKRKSGRRVVVLQNKSRLRASPHRGDSLSGLASQFSNLAISRSRSLAAAAGSPKRGKCLHGYTRSTYINKGAWGEVDHHAMRLHALSERSTAISQATRRGLRWLV